MKKTITFLLFIICVSQTNAQLTNSQVYNFEIGDVFQITFSAGFPGPHPVVVDTIVNKTYSTGLDSIIYTVNRLEYLAPATFGAPATFNYSVETLIITNLSLHADHYTYSTCLPATDTMIIGNCNETIERLHSNFDTTCFEPSTWYSDLYEGLGGPYYYSYDPTISGSGNDWYSKTLSYYNTSQHGECGTLLSFVGLNELVEINVNVFPKPASDKLHVKTQFQQCRYKIISATGSLIKSGSNQEHEFEIDISLLQKGIYTIEIDGNNGYLIKKSFIKG